MVNNYEYIKKHLHFLNERSFYFVQILKRKKENPKQKAYSQPIENFYIFSTDQFEHVMPHIIEKCEQNRARAYIKMNCLDAQSVMLETISVLSQDIRKEDWKHLSAAVNSACGICGKQNGTEKLYLVDLDNVEVGSDEMQEYINAIEELEPVKYKEYDEYGHTMIERIDKVKMIVPTRNGCHLLTTGFNKQKFSMEHPKIDVHDDGITLLYYPECCDDKQKAKLHYPEMVDLGLPSGIKWASCNLGATKPEEYGNYYAWGDTKEYNGIIKNELTIGSGKYDAIDGPMTLESSDDAVTAALGCPYRLPTRDECKELVDETNHEFTSLNGVLGIKFINKSDESKFIFVPFAGFRRNGNIYGSDNYFYLWSSTRDRDVYNAYLLNGDGYGELVYDSINNRFYCFSVRAVSCK